MRLVNKTWYYASLHPILLYDEEFVYNYALLDSFLGDHSKDYCIDIVKTMGEPGLPKNYKKFERVLLDSKRTLLNLKLNDMFIRSVLFEKLGDRIVSLNLILNFFLDSYLDSITNNCENLQTLQLQKIREFIIDFKLSRKPLLKMRSLSINNCFLSDKDFNILVQCVPNLTDISIDCDDIYILKSFKDIKKYYPNYPKYKTGEISIRFNSNDVFTNVNIINFLNSTNGIVNLKLSEPFIFSKLPKHIKLKSLILKSRTWTSDGGERAPEPLENIEPCIFTLNEQTLLETLEVDGIPCCFLSAVSNMHNLKYLKLFYVISTDCQENVDVSRCLKKFIHSLKNMKYIKTLQFKSVWYLDQCKEKIDKIPDCILTSLTSLDCSLKYNLNIIKFGNHLTELSIREGCFLTGNNLRLLFKNLKNLMHLSIYRCINLDDGVLSSSPVSNIKGKNYKKYKFKYFHSTIILYFRIGFIKD